MEVRDYECDIEGIVNNANYLHYMEHTRHLFLKECGLSFAEMHNKGVDIFLDALARMEQSLAGTDASILALCLVMGGHTGVNPVAVSGEPGADDNGQPFEISPDPLLAELQAIVAPLEVKEGEQDFSCLKKLYSRADVFGVDLYAVGLGEKIEGMVKEAEAHAEGYDYAAAVDRLRAGQDLAGRSHAPGDFVEASIIDTRLRALQSLLREQAAER